MTDKPAQSLQNFPSKYVFSVVLATFLALFLTPFLESTSVSSLAPFLTQCFCIFFSIFCIIFSLNKQPQSEFLHDGRVDVQSVNFVQEGGSLCAAALPRSKSSFGKNHFGFVDASLLLLLPGGIIHGGVE